MLVYLDQNKWIEIAKMFHGKDKSERAARVLHSFETPCASGHTTVPLSSFHYVETSRISNEEKAGAFNDSLRANSQGVKQAFAGEFLTTGSCLSAIKEHAGGPPEIPIDKPEKVLGRLPDGRLFNCELTETHTKGSFIQGYIFSD